MSYRVLGWFSLVSVITIALLGFGLYITLLTFIVSFLLGILTILYLSYDSTKIFPIDIDSLDNPLQQTNFSVQCLKVLHLFQNETPNTKFDSRITGSETVDSFLNEIITIIMNDYVVPWYEVITTDQEFTTCAIKKTVVSASANVANRVKCVDWIHLLSTKFPEEITMHLKLFKQSRVRLKHFQLLSAKDINGTFKQSPKKTDERKTHRRNKSDTDLTWPTDSHVTGNSKFYDSTDNINSNNIKDIFFDLECSIENKQICRDIYCMDSEREYALVCEVAEAVLYLIAPEDVWRCHALKMILIELLSAVVLKPLISLLSDPDNINRTIIKLCCRDSSLSSELFLMVIRCCTDAEELDATLELVQKDIQKLVDEDLFRWKDDLRAVAGPCWMRMARDRSSWRSLERPMLSSVRIKADDDDDDMDEYTHSRDSAGEWDLQDRQKLSSLQYLSRIINARRATLGPQEGSSNSGSNETVSEEVSRTLKFLRAIAAWRSNAQYLLEIELNEPDAPYTSKAVLDNLRSSALELCDTYLSPRAGVLGLPEGCHADLVRRITTDGDEFTANPVACFDDVQKCVCDALEDDPSWQADFMMDEPECSERPNSDVRKDPKLDKKYGGDVVLPVASRHNRSRSDVVGSFAEKMMNECAGPSNLKSANTSTLSLSHSAISQSAKNMMSPLSALIIETALVQDKGRTFGIYAIAVTRASDNEVWHIYRRYSDFYDLHCAIKDKWPELAHLPFPAKKTFQNTSRSVLESRKRILNSYLQSLTSIGRDARYLPLLSHDYLGGFLSPENQTERHGSTIDALLVNPIKAGMRTLKSMPDQFANTVDGVMDGISKVFQGKGGENYYDGLKSGSSSDVQDDGDESVPLKLLEEVLGIRGLWLRRRLLAPLRTMIAERVNRKVLEFVSSLTSPRNVVQYLKTFKQWLTSRGTGGAGRARDGPTRARSRIAAKVALLSLASDELKHIVGTDAARRGLLTVFDLFQAHEINRRLILVLLEATLCNLFPDNNIQDMFKKLYSHSPRVTTKKTVKV